MLVYSSFGDFLTLQAQTRDLSSLNQAALAKRWSAYHAEMIRFYYANQDRCLLLNIRAFENEISKIASLMRERFDVEARIVNSRTKIDNDPIVALLAHNSVELIADAEVDEVFGEMSSSADAFCDEKTQIEGLLKSAVQRFQTLEEAALEQSEQLIVLKARAELQEAEFDAERKNYEAKFVSLKEQLIKFEGELREERASHLEISSEKSLIMSQLHQAHEELEYYFRKSLQFEEETNKVDEPARQDNQPSPARTEHDSLRKPGHSDNGEADDEISLDFTNFLDGSGWHNAEKTGRWAGPAKVSRLNIPKMAYSNYRMTLRITDGMSLSILENLKVSLNGRHLSVSIQKFCDLEGALAPVRRFKADITNVEKPYPAAIIANIPKSYIDTNKTNQEFEFSVPQVLSPSSNGANDPRELSLYYSKLTLKQQ